MRIITEKHLKAFAMAHNCLDEMNRMVTILRQIAPKNLTELRESFPTADPVDNLTVINFKGNHYRIITAIHYNRNRMYILEILTHAEYDKGQWKKKYGKTR